MRLPSLLGHCREALEEITADPARPADLYLGAYFRNRRYLGSRDRRLISEMFYDVLRGWLRSLFILHGTPDEIFPEPSSRFSGEILALVLLEKNPGIEPEVVIEGCGLTPERVAELPLLLADAPSRISRLTDPERLAVTFSLPLPLAVLLRADYPDDHEELMRELVGSGSLAIRANRLRITPGELAWRLAVSGIKADRARYASDGLILEHRLNLQALPEFRDGLFEVQDEGSQLLSPLLKPEPGQRVFDACAGGGGKTLHLAALMEGKGRIIAHDLNSMRLRNLSPRLERSGATNVEILSHEKYLRKREQLSGSFDALLIDAPCSGTGTLRRNPGMRLSFSEEMLREVIAEQAGIIDEYSALVRPGGRMLYATCSLLRAENQDQIRSFLERHAGWEVEPVDVGHLMKTEEGFFRSLPHLHRTDGFFGALLRRTG